MLALISIHMDAFWTNVSKSFEREGDRIAAAFAITAAMSTERPRHQQRLNCNIPVLGDFEHKSLHGKELLENGVLGCYVVLGANALLLFG